MGDEVELFKTVPFAHQLAELNAHGGDISRAIHWEQGTGKSKLFIDTACRLYRAGEIDAALVIAPNGVHRNWVTQEIPIHMPDDLAPSVRALFYQSKKANTLRHKRSVADLIAHKGFVWLTMGYEAFMTEEGKNTVWELMKKRKLIYGLDEAQAIKEPTAKRTKSILKSAPFAKYRRTLTGTPVAQGPFDLYSQISFLDPTFWKNLGFGSYTIFKQHFGVWRKGWNPTAIDPRTKKPGREFSQLVSYRNLSELSKLITPIASRVTKDQVLDLPPKLYTKDYFPMSDAQAKHYTELSEEFVTWVGEGCKTKAQVCPVCNGTKEITVDDVIVPCDCLDIEDSHEGQSMVVALLAIVRLLRLQQVTCGYLPTPNSPDSPLTLIDGPNRRLDRLLERCRESASDVIIWARFRQDINLIMEALSKEGLSAVRYDGLVDDDERAESIARFTGIRAISHPDGRVERSPVSSLEKAKFFVANPAAGATGLTLANARHVIYYSNSFKLVDRLQSEDRCHRIGQTNAVLYADLIAEDTVDDKIVGALRDKKSIADLLVGDGVRDWI